MFLNGGNPYDPESLSGSLSEALGGERASATMMWNPPWTLPLTVPFAILPIRLAHLLWVAVQLTLTLLSANLLWRAYGGRADPGGLFRAAVLLFPPTVFLIVYGQIGALCLFGVAGFLFFMSRDRPVPAGLCVALTAIKPHLFAFGLYLLLEALVSHRDRIALLTGTIAVVATAVAAWQINPTVYADYFAALSAPPGTTGFVSVQDWRLPLGSYWLRMSVAPISSGCSSCRPRSSPSAPSSTGGRHRGAATGFASRRCSCWRRCSRRRTAAGCLTWSCYSSRSCTS